MQSVETYRRFGKVCRHLDYKNKARKKKLQDTAVGRTYTDNNHNSWFLLSFALYPDPYSQANYRIPPP
jgi:hypothetical protein